MHKCLKHKRKNFFRFPSRYYHATMKSKMRQGQPFKKAGESCACPQIPVRDRILSSTRFGEGLRIVQDHLDSKNFYAFNPEFDRCKE